MASIVGDWVGRKGRGEDDGKLRGEEDGRGDIGNDDGGGHL